MGGYIAEAGLTSSASHFFYRALQGSGFLTFGEVLMKDGIMGAVNGLQESSLCVLRLSRARQSLI
ncbi:MAG: hypothetical protein DMG05_07285 [Acidobacteria bacterium]|nr:MAG: hypothetical protein DMG05_07285 [Acidobacteriota bacterium]